VSEEVNMKLPAKNTMIELLTLYSDPERHSGSVKRQKEGPTT